MKRTLNLDVHRVSAVLNAMDHFAAIGARVFGPQLCYLNGGISRNQWVVDQCHPVQVLCLYINFPI